MVQSGAKSSVLVVSGTMIFKDLKIGDSVAVNGVCLTVKEIRQNTFMADVMHETLDRSSLGLLKNRSHVNLERAMPVDGRFGGHIVSGHIDGVGKIVAMKADDNAVWFNISTEEKILHYIIEKGSIAIDGISLTVARVGNHDFSVSIIPHTISNTTLSEKKVGDVVNLENDVVGKYIEKLLKPLSSTKEKSNLTEEFLEKYGY